MTWWLRIIALNGCTLRRLLRKMCANVEWPFLADSSLSAIGVTNIRAEQIKNPPKRVSLESGWTWLLASDENECVRTICEGGCRKKLVFGDG